MKNKNSYFRWPKSKRLMTNSNYNRVDDKKITDDALISESPPLGKSGSFKRFRSRGACKLQGK